MEIHGFCDTTRLLHKWNIYSWKLVLKCANTLQILMSSFDIASGAENVITWR